MNLVRNLTDNNWSNSDEKGADEDVTQNEEMEIETQLQKPGRFYKDQVMQNIFQVENVKNEMYYDIIPH